MEPAEHCTRNLRLLQTLSITVCTYLVWAGSYLREGSSMDCERSHQCPRSSLRITSRQPQWLVVPVGIHSQETLNE